MNFDALLLDSPTMLPQKHRLEAHTAAEWSAEKKKHAPAVLIIQESRCQEILQFADVFVDRGWKKPTKELAAVMLRQEKIPLIRGVFLEKAKFLRSIRVLINRAKINNDNNLYFITLNDEFFEMLQESAEQAQSQPASQTDPVLKEASLLQLLNPREIPATIRLTFLGKSLEVQLVHQLILRAAEQNEPILIVGETGTGKEVVARCIHRSSKFKTEPFIPVNCSGIPEDLFATELFGHVVKKMANTLIPKPGLWEAAKEGYLFFDEIGDLPMTQQAKILTVLDTQKIHHIGGTEAIPVRARIIATTSRDLYDMVQKKQFREDLYYRLRAFVIHTPSLRSHPQDIPDLAIQLWRRIVAGDKVRLSKKMLEELKNYRWSGNVREMNTVLKVLHGYFGSTNLRLEHLQSVLQQQTVMEPAPSTMRSAADLILFRVDCLHHLRQVDELLRQVKVTLRPLLYERTTPYAAMAIIDSLQKLIIELDILCNRPLLFFDDALFHAVRHLNGKFREFSKLLARSEKKAKELWQAEIVQSYNQTQKMVFLQVKKLMK
jgi:DNA-binding NtrC family response regulator